MDFDENTYLAYKIDQPTYFRTINLRLSEIRIKPGIFNI